MTYATDLPAPDNRSVGSANPPEDNNLNARAITAIRDELGTNPSGDAATVEAALAERAWRTGELVFDVTHPDYGAVGDGVTDDYPAFVAAASALATAGGGVLLVPEADVAYLLDSATATHVDLPSNTTVLGWGRASLIKRGANYAGQMVFRINGTSHVTVQGVACDFNNAAGFFRFIGLRGTDPHHLRFLDNRIFDSNPDTLTSGDKWAFNLSAESGTISNLWIERNHSSDDMQLVSGGQNFFNVWVTDNVCDGGRSNAIALTNLGDNKTFENIVVSGNTVKDPVGMGIIVGPDNNGVLRAGTVGRNIKVADNIVRVNAPAAAVYAIEVRSFNVQQDVEITGNRIVDASGTTNASSEGIRLVRQSDLTASAVGETAVVANNQVIGFNTAMRIQHWSSLVVAGNVLRNSGTYGCYLQESSNVDIAGNFIGRAGNGIYVQASADVAIRGNTVRDCTQNFGSHLTLNGSSTASITTLSATVVGNRFGPKSGTNTVRGILQAGSGSFVTHLMLNDVTGTDAVAISAGTFASRWLNRGEQGQRAGYPVEEFTAAKTWDPLSIAADGVEATTVAVAGAAVGDVATATLDSIGANNVLLSAHVEAAGTVRVVLLNKTGAALDLASGTLRVNARRAA